MNESEHTTMQNLWDTVKAAKGKAHSNIDLSQGTRKKVK